MLGPKDTASASEGTVRQGSDGADGETGTAAPSEKAVALTQTLRVLKSLGDEPDPFTGPRI